MSLFLQLIRDLISLQVMSELAYGFAEILIIYMFLFAQVGHEILGLCCYSFLDEVV